MLLKVMNHVSVKVCMKELAIVCKGCKAERIRPREMAHVAMDTRLRGHSINGVNISLTVELRSDIFGLKTIFNL